MMHPALSPKKTVLRLAAAALVLAVIRYFLKGWLEPLGIPTVVGSFLASVTVVLLIAIVLLFYRQGRAGNGRYWRAAVAFLVLAVWCELLVIAGILITERTGAQTFFQGPWEAVVETFPTPAEHAIGHTQGFFFRTAIGLLLGAAFYGLGRRSRLLR